MCKRFGMSYTNVLIMKLEEAVKRRRKNKNYYLLEGWARKKKKTENQSQTKWQFFQKAFSK